jgi:hypothetical protein
MRGRTGKLLAGGIVIVVAGAIAGAPAGASQSSCLKDARSGKVIAASKRAVAWKEHGKVHACAYSAAHSVVLPHQGRMKIGGDKGAAFIDPRLVTVAGRYVAYGWRWTQFLASANPPYQERVFVYDAAGRAVKHRGKKSGVSSIGAIVVKPDGSVAWTFTNHNSPGFPDTTHVAKIDKTSGGQQELDASKPVHYSENPYEIGPRSLALSANGKRVYWTRDPGGTQTAPLR